jgi:hypothetical protein
MKIKPVHVGLVIAAVLMLSIWLSTKLREHQVTEALAQPVRTAPGGSSSNDALANTPEAQAYRGRLGFQQQVRDFLRDAPKLDEKTSNARALELNNEISRREKSKEFSADEALMLRIGLIHAVVKDDRERVRQAQKVVDRYRAQSEARKTAFEAEQRRDAQFQEYKAREARIVSEVMAMRSYPNGISRDDYVRIRLQEAREGIYSTEALPPKSATTP